MSSFLIILFVAGTTLLAKSLLLDDDRPIVMTTESVSYTHLTLPTTPYV